MSTITDLQSTDNGSTSLATINTNFDNLNTDKLEAATTATLTNKTIDGDTNTVQDLALTSLKTVLADASKFIVRDASGIPVSNTKAVPSGTVVGHTDSITLTNKTMDAASNTFQNMTGTIDAATTSAAGKIEVATAAETTTGTDTTRAVSPDGLAGSDYGKRVVGVLVVDPATNIATGDGKAYFRIPSVMNGWNLVAVAAHVFTAGTTNTTDVQISRTRSGSSVDMLSTKITIDSTEVDSSTAATAAVINASNDDVNTADRISVDIDATHTTPAKGLYVELVFQLP